MPLQTTEFDPTCTAVTIGCACFARGVCELGQMLQTATGLVGGVGNAAAQGAQQLWRRIGPVGFLCGAILLFLLYQKMRPETKARVRSAASTGFEVVMDVFGEYHAVRYRFEQAAPEFPTWDVMAETMAPSAVLARSCLHFLARYGPSNCSARGLRALLPDLSVPHGEAKVRETLRSNGCFSEAWAGRWQVGHVARAGRFGILAT
jgi:hypothetical protein